MLKLEGGQQARVRGVPLSSAHTLPDGDPVGRKVRNSRLKIKTLKRAYKGKIGVILFSVCLFFPYTYLQCYLALLLSVQYVKTQDWVKLRGSEVAWCSWHCTGRRKELAHCVMVKCLDQVARLKPIWARGDGDSCWHHQLITLKCLDTLLNQTCYICLEAY